MLQQLFATPRDLEEAGIARRAIQDLSLAQRRRNLVKASGWLAPALRKRNKLPLVVELDPASVDASGMAGGATATPAIAAGSPTLVEDVAIQFAVSGPSTTYSINTEAGAYGSVAGPSSPFTGAIMIDGITWTFTGMIDNGDIFAYSTVTDPGVVTATTMFAAWLCLHNRGVDPGTEKDLQRAYDAAAKLKAEIAAGEGDLEESEDATGKELLGPRGDGQREPWSFLRRGRERWPGR